MDRGNETACGGITAFPWCFILDGQEQEGSRPGTPLAGKNRGKDALRRRRKESRHLGDEEPADPATAPEAPTPFWETPPSRSHKSSIL